MKKYNHNIIFLKMGGFLITSQNPPAPNLTKIREIATQLHKLKRKMEFRILVGHGSGSFLWTAARKFKTTEGIINNKSLRGQSVVENGASKLNREVVDQLIKAGENAISVSPSASIATYERRIRSFYYRPIKYYLKNELVPVVYEDVVLDYKRGCSILGVEEIFRYLVKKLKPAKIIIMSEFKGVYNARKKIISEINKKNFKEIKKQLEGLKRTRQLRKLIPKLKKAVRLAKKGVGVHFIGGGRRDLEKCLKGEKTGTLIKF